MLFKIPLKNSDKTVLVDQEIYEYFKNDSYFKKIKFLENIRLHSGGYAVFQKAWAQTNGKYKTETIYLHKYIAEKFLEKPDSKKRLVVRVINGKRLDCRKKNLEWSSTSIAVRKGKFPNKTGYRGVKREGNRFRATIYHEGKLLHIGMFSTPEEAALAFNEKSKELFGDEGKLNSVVLEKN